MAKRSQRHSVLYEGDQSGCIWGLISMFDFRHRQLTQQLLSDGSHGSRHAVATGIPKNKLGMLINLDENCRGTFVFLDGKHSRATAVDAGKPSVKKLIEKEMFSGHGTKKEINNTKVEVKQSNAEDGGHRRKNWKRRNTSRSKSCGIHTENLDVENLELERGCPQNSEQSANNLDIEEIMEEFCRNVHHESINCINHDQHGEVDDEPNQKNPEFEEKLSEAIKLFISQKLVNGNHVRENGDIKPSKELRNALRFLSSDEELLLKLLRGPESVMAKHVQSLWNAQVEKDKDSKSLMRSNLSEQKLNDLKQSGDLIHRKQHKSFRRKAKDLEESPSKGKKASQASNRIVILKAGPTGLQNSETKSSLGSSSQSHFISRSKEPSVRGGSHFFLSEIKRKLKHAMRREQREISSDHISNRLPKCHAMGDNDKGFRENVGTNSPSKDHFFIEKIARPPMSVKKCEKACNLKQCMTSAGHETANNQKQGVSNIYVEAKKHLSEMLNNRSGDVDFSNRQVPKSLGRILSLPEYNFSPMSSPGRDLRQSFVTAQMRFTAGDKFHKQEASSSQLGGTTLNLESQSCVSDDSTDNKEEFPSNPNSSASNELGHDNGGVKTFCSTGDEMISEGDVEIEKSNEVLPQEESNFLDVLPEKCCPSTTRDDQNDNMTEVCDGERCPEHMKYDLHKEHQPPITKKVEDIEGATETPERPSPVSVLESLFPEDDINPASNRSQAVELPMQPVRIQFEERDPSAADQGFLKICTEDKESIFEFVKAVLQASGVNWGEFYMWSHSSDELLDPSIFDEVEFFSNQLCCDKKLLFDCINEVLVEVYIRHFGCFLELPFVKPAIRSASDMKNTICEVWRGVYWHLLPLPLPRTLDQIVKKDVAKTGTWMDLQCDAETIIVGIGESIFEDLIKETILSCINASLESGNPLIPARVEGK